METVKVAEISSSVADDSTKKAEEALVTARGVLITNDLEYTSAGNFLVQIKKFLKDLEVERKKITDPIQQAKDAVLAFFNSPKNSATKAMELIGAAMQKYDDNKKEMARKENARLQDLANKEAAKLAEKAKKEAEKGNTAKAEELKQQAEFKKTVVPQVAAEPVKVAGLGYRDNWTFEIVDVKLIPREYMEPDTKKIGQVVRATKGTLEIPGIKVIKEQNIGGSR